MANSYDYVKKWRKKNKKNCKYGLDYMKTKRREWKEKFERGEVKYENIPKSYRYFVKPKKK